jgi:hypothetical protein
VRDTKQIIQLKVTLEYIEKQTDKCCMEKARITLAAELAE